MAETELPPTPKKGWDLTYYDQSHGRLVFVFKCPHCGAGVPDGSLQCWNCGLCVNCEGEG